MSAPGGLAGKGVLQVAVRGIGLLGPGLADWASGQALLREPRKWVPQATFVPPPERLPATERRRASLVVKASIGVADQACIAAGIAPASLATVFSSSTGDPLNCHLLCEALAAPERLVSPTRFTNSVHNAAAGYWHIATASRQPSTSLAAFDASFAAGLLEAAVQCASTQAPILLVACDVPYPEPLHALRPVADVFAVALLLAPLADAWAAPGLPLSPPGSDQVAQQPGTPMLLRVVPAAAPTVGLHAGLERLRQTIPAACALPLLCALALRQAGPVLLAGHSGLALQVDLAPAQGH